MAQGYLTVIEELVFQNEQVKAQNRKLASLVEELLDSIIEFFGQFFPSVATFDSNSLEKACKDILIYYKKQMLIIRSQLSKQFLQVLNLYDIQIEDELQTNNFDNFKEFFSLMKNSKGSLKQQLFQHQLQIQQLQTIKNRLQKDLQNQQLQLKKMSIVLQEQAGDLERATNSNQLLSIEVSNLSKQIRRANDQYQTLQSEFSSAESQLNQIRLQNDELRRQIINLQQQRIPNNLISIKFDRRHTEHAVHHID